MVSLWVVNASPIILLAKVGLVDLLRQLGPAVVIPDAAVREIQRRGSADAGVQALAQAAWLLSVDPGPIPPAVSAFGLGDGESGVLAHALANPGIAKKKRITKARKYETQKSAIRAEILCGFHTVPLSCFRPIVFS